MRSTGENFSIKALIQGLKVEEPEKQLRQRYSKTKPFSVLSLWKKEGREGGREQLLSHALKRKEKKKKKKGRNLRVGIFGALLHYLAVNFIAENWLVNPFFRQESDGIRQVKGLAELVVTHVGHNQ